MNNVNIERFAGGAICTDLETGERWFVNKFGDAFPMRPVEEEKVEEVEEKSETFLQRVINYIIPKRKTENCS